MSSALARRAFWQSSAAIRRLATSAGGGDKHGHAVNPELWRKISLYVCVPCIALATINTYLSELEHAKHPRPPYVPYEYLYIRKKRYPWGDGNHSFFHNPKANAVPGGYETEDPYYARNPGASGEHH